MLSETIINDELDVIEKLTIKKQKQSSRRRL